IDNTLASIAQENGLTPEQLRQSVEAQGLPYQAYRVRIRGEIEQAKVVNGMVAASVRVEDEEVRALYHKRFEDQPTEGEEVHLRQIVVGVREDSDAARSAACDRAETALARIEAGAAFAEVAYEVSDLNANTGGDVGWVHVDSLAAWMRSALDALEPGQMSGVLRTPFACTFLELVERRSYEPIRYEQVENRLRDELFDMRMQEEFLDFLDKIREQTYVERKGIYAGAPRQGTATLPATSGESPGP
ncbi:MAG: peptidylprolyl isomerase, partial [Myxococcota bacterium]